MLCAHVVASVQMAMIRLCCIYTDGRAVHGRSFRLSSFISSSRDDVMDDVCTSHAHQFCAASIYTNTCLSLSLTSQHRRTYGQDWINRLCYCISVDMGRYSPSEFQCCLAVWCQWSFLVCIWSYHPSSPLRCTRHLSQGHCALRPHHV